MTGCGFRFEQREPWRAQAEAECLGAKQVQPSAYMSRSAKIDGPGVCGMDYPFKVAAFAGGTVGVNRQVTLACPIIPRIEAWLEEVVKPAGTLYFGVPVVDLKAGSYSCRPRNNQRGAKLSEHSFGNALDIMAFVLADGREVTVLKGWRGDPAEQDFLREVFTGACRHFTTVLGPGADAFHYDHLHIDLARHDPRGERRICKPILKFEPRLDMPGAGGRRPAATPIPADLPPIDMEEEGTYEDEPAMSQAPARPAPVAGYGQPAPARPMPAPSYPAQPYPAPPPSAPARPLPAQAPMAADLPPPRGQGLMLPPASVPSAPPAPGRSPLHPEPYRAPLYNRPPVTGQAPQILNGHGIY
ncbi:MAG TPA: extensin family protein [Microvirga sp.]